MSALPSLNLLVLKANDPDQLCRFYSGLGLHFIREQHGNGPVHHASELAGSVFEIYPRKPEEPPTTATRLGFIVPSLDAALLAVRGAQGVVLCEPCEFRQGRRAVVCDPEGHKVELVER
jgi:predicted enzyme related to lactoylglutathione lyase